MGAAGFAAPRSRMRLIFEWRRSSGAVRVRERCTRDNRSLRALEALLEYFLELDLRPLDRVTAVELRAKHNRAE